MQKKRIISMFLLLTLTAFGMTSCYQKTPTGQVPGQIREKGETDPPSYETLQISYDVKIYSMHTDSYELDKLSLPGAEKRKSEEPVMIPVRSLEMLNRLYESHDSRSTKGPAGWISEKSSRTWEKMLKYCTGEWFDNQTLWIVLMDDILSDDIRYVGEVTYENDHSCFLSARLIAPSPDDPLTEQASGTIFFIFLPKTASLDGVTVTNENGWKNFKNDGKPFGVTVSAEDWLKAISEANFD